MEYGLVYMPNILWWLWRDVADLSLRSALRAHIRVWQYNFFFMRMNPAISPCRSTVTQSRSAALATQSYLRSPRLRQERRSTSSARLALFPKRKRKYQNDNIHRKLIVNKAKVNRYFLVFECIPMSKSTLALIVCTSKYIVFCMTWPFKSIQTVSLQVCYNIWCKARPIQRTKYIDEVVNIWNWIVAPLNIDFG